MKYLISYLPREFVIQGIFIPKKGYTQDELNNGKREVVAVTDEQIDLLQKDPIFLDYMATKKMRILDKAPENLLSGAERIANLQAENQALKAANKDDGKVKALETEISSIKEEAIAKVNELEGENAALKARLAKLEKEGK